MTFRRYYIDRELYTDVQPEPWWHYYSGVGWMLLTLVLVLGVIRLLGWELGLP